MPPNAHPQRGSCPALPPRTQDRNRKPASACSCRPSRLRRLPSHVRAAALTAEQRHARPACLSWPGRRVLARRRAAGKRLRERRSAGSGASGCEGAPGLCRLPRGSAVVSVAPPRKPRAGHACTPASAKLTKPRGLEPCLPCWRVLCYVCGEGASRDGRLVSASLRIALASSLPGQGAHLQRANAAQAQHDARADDCCGARASGGVRRASRPAGTHCGRPSRRTGRRTR